MPSIFRYFFAVLACVILYFSFTDTIIKKDKLFVQNEINKQIPIKLSKATINVNVNKLEVSSEDNKIKADMLLDLNSPIFNYVDKKGTVTLIHSYVNGKVFLKIQEIGFDNLTFSEFTSDAIKNSKPIIENTKNKIAGFFKNKLGMEENETNTLLKMGKDKLVKIKEKHNLNKEKVQEILYSLLRSYPIEVVDIGIASIVVKDIQVNHYDNSEFDITVTASGGILGIIIGFLILFFSLSREIGLGLISFYQNFLSDKKGYNCARGVVTGDGTCSSITKKKFEEEGFISGMKEYFDTTKKCKEDHEEYKKNKDYYDEKRRKKDSNNNYCDCGTCPSPTSSRSGKDCEVCDCGDISATKLTACEIGACASVGSCDVGSC